MNPLRTFTQHPASAGETYLEHLLTAAGFSGRMILAGFACLLHGVFPFLFAHTASDCIARLYARMMARRVSADAAVDSPSAPSSAPNQTT